jgi:hypothetical protein
VLPCAPEVQSGKPPCAAWVHHTIESPGNFTFRNWVSLRPVNFVYTSFHTSGHIVEAQQSLAFVASTDPLMRGA